MDLPLSQLKEGIRRFLFIKIPPQVQLDIAARKENYIDEHSGRILVDSLLAEEQSTKI